MNEDKQTREWTYEHENKEMCICEHERPSIPRVGGRGNALRYATLTHVQPLALTTPIY